MTNSQWKDFPFTANGINFISRVDTTHPIYNRINSLPAGAFEALNIQCVSEIMALDVEYTLEDLNSELERVNAGGSYAFILLGDNN